MRRVLGMPHTGGASEFLPGEDADGGEEDDFQVEPHGAVGHIVEVHVQSAEHLLDGVGVAVVERCHGEDAWAHGVELGIARVALHDLFDEELSLGARPDERHVAD